MGSVEARAAKRIPAGNRVSLVSQGRMVLTAVAVNISMGGVYLSASGSLPEGSPCEVAIFPPEGNGTQGYVTQGKVVRAGAEGLAIQFASLLGERTLDVLIKPPPLAAGASWMQSYVHYFKVSQSNVGADCERVFGVSRNTFRRVSTLSFVTSIPVAILPVWIFREYIPAFPDWVKIGLSFCYGALWLLVLQPFIDLGIFRALRAKASKPTPGA